MFHSSMRSSWCQSERTRNCGCITVVTASPIGHNDMHCSTSTNRERPCIWQEAYQHVTMHLINVRLRAGGQCRCFWLVLGCWSFCNCYRPDFIRFSDTPTLVNKFVFVHITGVSLPAVLKIKGHSFSPVLPKNRHVRWQVSSVLAVFRRNGSRLSNGF